MVGLIEDWILVKRLLLQALNQVIASPRQTAGLAYHLDHTSAYRLTEYSFAFSTGTVGDLYDSALAENDKDSYKSKLIHTPWWLSMIEIEPTTFK